MDSLNLAHAKWKCQYHIVFIPKYRRRVLYGKLRLDIKEVIPKLCGYKNIEIIEREKRFDDT
ncbi:Transposase IS200 like [Megasphaera paucivorans]|uniref:Transposase IS200 like n=1 Tax=Megasphaera paucivorans TaxID=349095 RepID=A0A1G9WZC6_9FIRM|nr:Transposase IS200 like [Megasphaera paucivorans]